MNLLTSPNEILSSPSHEVQVGEIDSLEFQELIDRMIAESRERGALGLAAPQIGISKRLFVMRTSKLSDDFLVFINPQIIVHKDKVKNHGEACLSLPGRGFHVPRFKTIVVDALDRNGNPFLYKTRTKINAFAIQHEVDHLDGILICDKGVEM